jgi:hypothetical protein
VVQFCRKSCGTGTPAGACCSRRTLCTGKSACATQIVAETKLCHYRAAIAVDSERKPTENVRALPPSDTPRQCPHCSHALGADAAQLCPSCGRALDLEPAPAPAPVRRSPRWFQASIAAVASVAAGAVIVLLVIGVIRDRNNPLSIFRFGKGKPPVYQWVQGEDKTLSILPGEGKAWGPLEPQGGEIRYTLSAYLPVDTGLMGMEWADKMDGWSAMKTSASCYEARIVTSSKICQMKHDKPYLFFIRDVRGKQMVLGDTPEFLNKNKKLQEQNNVTITTFTRKCMENCK